MDKYLLEARLDDAIKSAYNTVKYIGFLDPAQAKFLQEKTRYDKSANFMFWGGFEDAERLVLAVSVSDVEDANEFPITAITIKFRKEDVLSHRDFLGCFMSLGVDRTCIGDILVEVSRAVVFVKSELCDYFINSLTKIGKVGIKCSVGAEYPLPIAHSFKDLSGVVASQRADCVLAFLLKTSREKAAQAIKSGIVMCNYEQINSVSQKINDNDKIAVKGTGKFLVTEFGSLTKKNRITIRCKKYI